MVSDSENEREREEQMVPPFLGGFFWPDDPLDEPQEVFHVEELFQERDEEWYNFLDYLNAWFKVTSVKSIFPKKENDPNKKDPKPE